MANATKELLEYCYDILDFAHVEYGTRPVLHQPFDLKKLLHSVLNMQKPTARSKETAFIVAHEQEYTHIILGDPLSNPTHINQPTQQRY